MREVKDKPAEIRHVVHVIDQLRIGGAQKLLVTFARAAQPRALQVDIICLRNEQPNWIISELEDRGVRVFFLPARKLLDPFRFVKLVGLIRQAKPDIVHTHLTYANILGGLAASLSRVPSVAALHLAGPDRRYSRIREALETRVIRHITRTAVAVGPATGRLHAERLKPAEIKILLNAVDEQAEVSGDRGSIRQGLGIPASHSVLISVGRFSIVKGFHFLLEAFADVREKFESVSLLIVGDGAMKEPCVKLAADLGISDAVFLPGFRDDVPQLLAESDIYVCSSTVEGTPLAVMEAIMSGLPVVSTGVGDLPVIVDSSFGILVPPEDPPALSSAILSVLTDPDRRQTMAQNARQYGRQHFSSEVWLNQLLEIYSEVISPGQKE